MISTLRYEAALQQHPVARVTWSKAEALYQQAVVFAEWCGLPVAGIICICDGWFWGNFSWSTGWVYRAPPPWESPRSLVVFDCKTYEVAQAVGLPYGKRITNEGEIRPYEDTPAYKAAQAQAEADEWARLERLTRPTPVSELPKARRRQVARWAMEAQQRKEAARKPTGDF